jgi:uncharacterized membrane protein
MLLSGDNPLSEAIRLVVLIALAFWAGEWHAWGYRAAWNVVVAATAIFFTLHIWPYVVRWAAGRDVAEERGAA